MILILRPAKFFYIHDLSNRTHFIRTQYYRINYWIQGVIIRGRYDDTIKLDGIFIFFSYLDKICIERYPWVGSVKD